MNAGDYLALARALPMRTLDTIVGVGGILVVAPHPDDESLGCGGLIAAARANGMDVRLLVLSDGTGSHPGSRMYPPARLRALREAETLAAGRELGLASDAITFLGLPDRAVLTEGAQADAARSAIVAQAAACRAALVCVSWPHDPHCDHVAAAELVLAARERLAPARILFYPVWGWTLPPHTVLPGALAPTGFRLDIARFASAKAAAIAAHRSQVTDMIDDDPHGFRLSDEMLANFAHPYEVLLDAVPGGAQPGASA